MEKIQTNAGEKNKIREVVIDDMESKLSAQSLLNSTKPHHSLSS